MAQIKFSQKQNEYIRNANRRWGLKVGAVRSGKSYVDIAGVIPYRLRMLRDESGLNVILGVSKETIERNVLQPMREIYTDKIVGSINSRNIAKVCGVDVYCLGAEKISQVAKIQGSSIKYCYGDEIAKWNKDVFAMLQSRLDKPYSRFDGSCNPEYPGHWLKQFIDNPEIDAYIQPYTIFDNPFLPPEFVDNLCKEYTGTVYYKRYILGEWAMAEGLIYPMYEAAIAEEPSGNASQYIISMDYGTQNAFAAILWGKYGDVWYGLREYYYSGRDTGTQKTDEEYGEDIDEWVADIGGNIKVAIDPSAASFIALLRKKPKFSVMKANNDVADGIRETATALQIGKIKISPSMKNWKKEVEGYVWDETAQEDKPVKVNDHLMDATRYFVKTFRISQKKSTYIPIW
jgi:PBSX family phage terminase large subunit